MSSDPYLKEVLRRHMPIRVHNVLGRGCIERTEKDHHKPLPARKYFSLRFICLSESDKGIIVLYIETSTESSLHFAAVHNYAKSPSLSRRTLMQTLYFHIQSRSRQRH
jgi:hypothetical protein